VVDWVDNLHDVYRHGNPTLAEKGIMTKEQQRGHVGPDEQWDRRDWIISGVICLIVAGVVAWLI